MAAFTEIVVEAAKLRDYCLSDRHPQGRHKARVFASRLGLTASDADFLRHRLEDAARSIPLQTVRSDAFGERMLLDFTLTTETGSAVIRSGWILRPGERVLRFVTCYVL